MSVAEVGLTATEATGAGDTVTAPTPLFPSTVAVMIALPGESAVTNPVTLTVATLGRPELQAIDLPERTLPCASNGSAMSWAVWPTVRSRLDGETRTATTGTGITWIWATADFPSMLAATGTVPTYRPVTTPDEETVAKLESATAQKTFRPVSTLPDASNADAVRVTVAPTTTLASGGATCTLATGAPECSSSSLLQPTTATAAAAATLSNIHVD
jgi:hypothetical protein